MYKKVLKITPDLLFWSTLIVMLILQIIYLKADSHQIRYEELAESIRNPYWYHHGLIYDGISSNIGWYGILHHIYNLFGFSLFSGRYVKTAFYIISMLFLALILRKHVPGKLLPIVILVAVGLSPINLYFSRMMTTYGIDIYYAIIWFFLIDSIKWNFRTFDCFKMFGAWFVVMIGCMSFPSLISYLPSMGILYLYRFWNHKNNRFVQKSVVFFTFSTFGFILPLLYGYFYIKSNLFFDANTNAGLFMGGGKLSFEFEIIYIAILTSINDLFNIGSSYYFELKYTDFNSKYTIFSLLILLLGVAWMIFHFRTKRINLFLIVLLLFLSIVLPNLAGNTPGLRRSTGVITAIYLFYAIFLTKLFVYKNINKKTKYLLLTIMFFIPLHNINSYFRNLQEAKNNSHFAYKLWFGEKNDPVESLRYWLDYTRRNQSLPCANEIKNCRYSEIYGALNGYRYWNGKPKTPITIFNVSTREYTKLSPKLWIQYDLEH